jgi:hypothetical protein
MVMVLAACGGDPAPSTTSTPEFPSIVVDAWLDAIGSGDYEAASTHVEPLGASIVLAIENELSDNELAELLESGWTPELTTSFWSSFRDDFVLFSGVSVGALVVGRHTDLSVDEHPFAVVTVDVDGTDGWILTRKNAAGAWQVDLLATMGGAFVPLVFDRVAALGADTAGDVIRRSLSESAIVSLDAAAIVYPDDIRLETEIARIRRVLESP